MIICYLIYVRVPVLVVLGLCFRAVDSGEERGLGEVHLIQVQIECLGDSCLNSLAYVSGGGEKDT